MKKKVSAVSLKPLLSSRKGALELSIGTIVIVVLGVTMLIMGMVLTRSIMCGALGLTQEVNSKVKSQLNTLFDSTEGEVACIGAGGEAIKMVPGKENIVYCSIKAPATAEYTSTAVVSGTSIPSLTKDKVQKWMTTTQWKGNVAPNDLAPKKVVRINIPDNAPEGNIQIQLQVNKDGQVLTTQDLDFEVSRVGFVRSVAC